MRRLQPWRARHNFIADNHHTMVELLVRAKRPKSVGPLSRSLIPSLLCSCLSNSNGTYNPACAGDQRAHATTLRAPTLHVRLCPLPAPPASPMPFPRLQAARAAIMPRRPCRPSRRALAPAASTMLRRQSGALHSPLGGDLAHGGGALLEALALLGELDQLLLVDREVGDEPAATRAGGEVGHAGERLARGCGAAAAHLTSEGFFTRK